VVPAAPKPFAHNGLAWNQTFVPGWFQKWFQKAVQGGFRQETARKPPAALPSRAAFTPGRHAIRLSPYLVVCLTSYLGFPWSTMKAMNAVEPYPAGRTPD